MKVFEKITESIDAMAEFLTTDNKGDNKGCAECAYYDECTGKETCKETWIEVLNREV